MIVYPTPQLFRVAPRPPTTTAAVMLPAAPPPASVELPPLVMAPMQPPRWSRP